MLQLLQILVRLPRRIDGVLEVSVVHLLSFVLRQLPRCSECISDLAAIHVVPRLCPDIQPEVSDVDIVSFNVFEPFDKILPDCLALLFAKVIVV